MYVWGRRRVPHDPMISDLCICKLKEDQKGNGYLISQWKKNGAIWWSSTIPCCETIWYIVLKKKKEKRERGGDGGGVGPRVPRGRWMIIGWEEIRGDCKWPFLCLLDYYEAESFHVMSGPIQQRNPTNRQNPQYPDGILSYSSHNDPLLRLAS